MADEPVYPEQLVVMDDAIVGASGSTIAVVDIASTMAGPAGTAGVVFPHGELWEVDLARPSQLVQLGEVSRPVRRSRLAATLIGDLRCAGIDHAGPAENGRPRRLEPHDDSWNRTPLFRGTGAPDTNPLARPLGRLLIAGDLLEDPAAEPVVRIAAGAQLLRSVLSDDRFGSLVALVPALTERTALLAAAVDDESIADLLDADPSAATTFGQLIDSLSRLCLDQEHAFPSLGSLAVALATLLGRMTSARDRRGDALGESAEMSSRIVFHSLGPDDFDDDLQFQSADLEVGERSVARSAAAAAPPPEDFRDVELVGPGLLQVTVARGDVGRWVRVLRREGLVPIAMAPLLPMGLMHCSELAVPPDDEVADLEIEILPASIANPRGDMRAAIEGSSTVGADAVRAAVQAGREAARAERLRHMDRASARWRECAALWDTVGDPGRAGLARRYAEESGRGTRSELHPRPLIADLLADALA